jgi:Sporulation protein YtrH
MILHFFVAMGMVLGGSLVGGVAAVLTHGRPTDTMMMLADQLKIWALVSTLGGTMDTIRVIETGLLGLNLGPVARQFMYLVAAFLGCQVGYLLVRWGVGRDTL